MTEGLEAMLRNEGAYQQMSSAALDFMARSFGEEMVLAPYLEAFSGSDRAANAPTP